MWMLQTAGKCQTNIQPLDNLLHNIRACICIGLSDLCLQLFHCHWQCRNRHCHQQILRKKKREKKKIMYLRCGDLFTLSLSLSLSHTKLHISLKETTVHRTTVPTKNQLSTSSIGLILRQQCYCIVVTHFVSWHFNKQNSFSGPQAIP